MAGYIMFLVIGLGLIPFAFWIDKVNANSTIGKEHPEKLKKPLHKRWWMYLIAVVLVVGSVANLADTATYRSSKPKSHRLASDKEMQKEYKKTVEDRENAESQNLPGQKLNKNLANKGESFWTAKNDKKVHIFAYDGKVTAIKYVLKPNIQSTVTCQSILEKLFNDKNLKYGNDKENSNDALLDNGSSYNLYSPACKKWYWISFSAADGKDMVSTFSVYSGKNSDAK